MEIAFSTQEELYRRLYPALSTKKREFSKNNIRFQEEDIWNYLKRTKWNYSNGLSLSTMVNDILNVESSEILEFVHINGHN